MSVTNIEWADRVWNPVTGCTKVSAGCKNCYAEGVANRFFATQYPPIGINSMSGPVAKTGHKADYTVPRKFTDVQTHEDRLLEPLRWRKPARIFVNSMSDLFHEDVPFEFIDRVFATMSLAPQHTFLVLTKRPERMRAYFAEVGSYVDEWYRRVFAINRRHRDSAAFRQPSGFEAQRALGASVASLTIGIHADRHLPNVHLGVSVENQQTADERIPLLLQTPAAIRWISYEPALGPVTFNPWLLTEHGRRQIGAQPGLSWIVVGGESGPGARPFDVAWARSTVEQCKAAGVPVFVKQLGAVPMQAEAEWRSTFPTRLLKASHAKKVPDGFVPWALGSRKGGGPLAWPEDLRVRELPEVRACR